MWRRLWQLGFDVREAWPALTAEDRRLLMNELRDLWLLALARQTDKAEG